MSSRDKNLSSHQSFQIRNASKIKVGLVVSEWNKEITEALYSGALKTLLSAGINKENIFRKEVPGSFELTLGAQFMAGYLDVDAVICLGCVITGETRHAEYICNAVANGLTQLSVIHNKAFVFGVLTPDTMAQAKARAGGKHGNKGVEAAVTALKMIELKNSISK